MELLNFTLALLNAFIKLFLVPIVSFLSLLLGDYTVSYSAVLISVATNINLILVNFVVPSMVWFINLIPPLTYQVCLLFLGLWLLMWEFELSVGMVLHVLTWIKKYLPFA